MFRRFGGFQPSAERNVLLLTIIRMASVGGCALVPGMAKFLGPMSMTVWMAEWCFAAMLLIAIVPSGLLADRIGRKKVLVMAGSFLVCGALLYLFAWCALVCRVAETFLGMGHGFLQGKDEALLYASLRRLGREENYDRIQGRVVAAEVAMCAINFVAGSCLAAIDPRLPFVYTALSYGTLFVTSFLVLEVREGNERAESWWAGARKTARACFGQAGPLREALLWFAILSACFRVVFWGYAGYFQETNAWAPLGLFLAVQCVIGWSFARFGGPLVHGAPYRLMGVLFAALFGTSLLAMGIWCGSWSFIVGLLHPALRGLSRVYFPVVMQQAVTAKAPEIRATITSVREMSVFFTYLVFLELHAVFATSAAGTLELVGGTLCCVAVCAWIRRKRF